MDSAVEKQENELQNINERVCQDHEEIVALFEGVTMRASSKVTGSIVRQLTSENLEGVKETPRS